MITLILASLITGLFFLLWKKERQAEPTVQGSPSRKVPLWLLLGILSMAALLSPKIKNMVKDIRQKHHF